jgi:hypothetical protein
MLEFLQESRYGGLMLTVGCVLILLAAILSLFNDKGFRHVGWLCILIFGISFLSVFSILETQGLELPDWIAGGRRRGGLIFLLWALGSYKLADWLYTRYLS